MVREVAMPKGTLRTLAALLIGCFFLCPAALAEKKEIEIVITFGGDTVLGSTPTIRRGKNAFDEVYAKEGPEYFFRDILKVIERDDLTVVNLENVFYHTENGKVEKTYSLRGLPEYAQVLAASSVEAVSIANNHTVDYGLAGAQATVAAVEAQKVGWFGSTDYVSGVYITEKHGIKIGLMGVYIPDWNKNPKPAAESLAKLRQAGCDLLIGVMHGGSEYAPKHNGQQTRLANWLIEEGVHLVAGHHPHVIQGLEVVKGRSVLYSLGNLVFGANPGLERRNPPRPVRRADKSLLAQVTFRFDQDKQYLGHQVNLIPLSPSGSAEYNDYQPVMLSGEEAQKAMAMVQVDSTAPLAPFEEGVGAVQPFVPAPRVIIVGAPSPQTNPAK